MKRQCARPWRRWLPRARWRSKVTERCNDLTRSTLPSQLLSIPLWLHWTCQWLITVSDCSSGITGGSKNECERTRYGPTLLQTCIIFNILKYSPILCRCHVLGHTHSDAANKTTIILCTSFIFCLSHSSFHLCLSPSPILPVLLTLIRWFQQSSAVQCKLTQRALWEVAGFGLAAFPHFCAAV